MYKNFLDLHQDIFKKLVYFQKYNRTCTTNIINYVNKFTIKKL